MMVAQKTMPRLQAKCQDEIGTKLMAVSYTHLTLPTKA